MKKLLIFCEGLWNRAGIERMTVELANLFANDTEVTIVSIDPYVREKCPYELNDKVKTLSLDSSFGKSPFALNLANIKALRKIVKKVMPDAVVTVATPLVRITTPAIRGMHIRHVAWEHFNLYAGSKIGSLFKMLAPHMADATVVLTEADARDFRNVHAPNIIAIPNFTSIGSNAPSECREKTILAVGRHEPQKGFDMLLKAWAKTTAPGWKLKIVGSGSQRTEHEQMAQDLGITDRVTFVDAHNKIAEEFQHASCFVLSSRFEGMVLVLLEAKMMGLPCISFDCPNSPREIIHDGLDGWLVENGDIDALANAMTMHLADMDTLREFGVRSREDAEVRYSPDAVKTQWINILG